MCKEVQKELKEKEKNNQIQDIQEISNSLNATVLEEGAEVVGSSIDEDNTSSNIEYIKCAGGDINEISPTIECSVEVSGHDID